MDVRDARKDELLGFEGERTQTVFKRHLRNLTQTELAEKVGMYQRLIGHYANGTRQMTLVSALSILKYGIDKGNAFSEEIGWELLTTCWPELFGKQGVFTLYKKGELGDVFKDYRSKEG